MTARRPATSTRLLLLAALAVYAPLQARADPAEPPLEYAIKATYLYKFAPFVDWPRAALGGPGSPFRLCIHGDDAVAVLADKAADGQQVAGHPVTVVHLNAVTSESNCNLLYAAGTPEQSAGQALAALRGKPTLTVVDSERVPDARAIVQFVIDRNRVRFDIDTGAAAENGIVVSSKLLGLAHAVRPER